MKKSKEIVFEGVSIKVESFPQLIRFSFGEKDTFGVMVTRENGVAWHVYGNDGKKLGTNIAVQFSDEENHAFCVWALNVLKADKSEHQRLKKQGFHISKLRSLDDDWEASSYDPI